MACRFNPDETDKKVSLGKQGPDNGIYVSLRQAEKGNNLLSGVAGNKKEFSSVNSASSVRYKRP